MNKVVEELKAKLSLKNRIIAQLNGRLDCAKGRPQARTNKAYTDGYAAQYAEEQRQNAMTGEL